MSANPERLAILVAFSGRGGVERMILNLLAQFSRWNIPVDLLPIVRKQWGMLDNPWPNVRVIDLKVRHTALAAPAVAGYLLRERPAVLLAVRDRAIQTAICARWLSRTRTPLIGNLHTHLSAALAKKTVWQRGFRLAVASRSYRKLDRIIAVSEGVARDTLAIGRLPPERVVAIANPVLDQEFLARGAAPLDHPHWVDCALPLIVGAGRLTAQKDFITLLQAFAIVVQTRPCRLLILGEGGKREELERCVVELKLEHAVQLPGHIDNPLPYMAKASLFVLSSSHEGSGNVLTEAMALGIPVVSTDCPSGPREMLGDGRFGRLTPVGDAQQLAAAMLETLDHPLSAATLQEAVREYAVERSARRYLEILGFANDIPKVSEN